MSPTYLHVTSAKMRCICFTVGFLFLLQSSLSRAAKSPNIIFILADDLGYGDLASYPNPNTTRKRLSTPNVDALRSQSMMFTEAYAGSTVCAPSRCTLMTGRHSGHCTVRDNGASLNSSDVTIAKILHDAGYYTALVGKWGLGGNGTIASPNAKGFDHFFGYTSQENAHNYYPPYLWRNDKQIFYDNNKNASSATCGYPRTTHCTWAEDELVNETVSLLKEMGNKDSPFYMFLSFTTPHAGAIGSNSETGIPGPYILSQYSSQKDWPEVEKYFASVVTMQDSHVGSVLKALDNAKLSDNTVVFFASDNGAHNEGGHDYKFFESSGPLRGFKRSLHEGGVRSPLLVRWPGVVKPNTLSKQQWAFWDFLQTAADIAGVKDPVPPHLDGYSFLPTLKGETQDQPKYIYHEYCHPNEDHQGYGQAVRFQDWKAVRYNGNNSRTELYDLSNDIGETVDVSSTNNDVVKMAQQYIDEAHVDGNDCIKTSSGPFESSIADRVMAADTVLINTLQEQPGMI